MYLLNSYFHRISLPPSLPITVAFILGIINRYTDFLSATSLLFLFFIVACCVIFIQKTTKKQYISAKTSFLYPFVLVAGSYMYDKNVADYNHFYTFTEKHFVEITGIIIDKNKATTHYNNATSFTISVYTIKKENEIRACNKTIMLYSNNIDTLEVGDTVTFYTNKCKQSSNQFFSFYQIKEQIAATIFDNTVSYIIHDHPTWSLRKWIWNKKQQLLNIVQNKLSPDSFRFFSSLFLGNRACVKNSLEKTNEQFKRWGISHFLARSGLHLALFIFVWQTLFCLVPLPFIAKQILFTVFSCIYFIFSWTSAPFTRSFALFFLSKLCLLYRLPFNLLHYVTIVCLCFLLYSPLYLFFLDFQLSFILTFALAWFNQLHTQQKLQ